MPKISKKIIEPPTITKQSKGNYEEGIDESPLLPLQNNPVMPLSGERPPIESPGAQPVTAEQETRTISKEKPIITGDLPKEQIKEPEREKEIANPGGAIGRTTWNPFAYFFRRDKKVRGKESQEAEKIATNLKTLQASLAILLTSPKLKDQEIGQLRLQIAKAMNALPEKERPAAWQRCLEQVINSESLKRFDTADEIHASGQATHQASEENQHPTTCRGLALAIIAELIFELPIGERLERWDQIKELFDDIDGRLTNEDIKRAACALVAQTQGLWPEEGCGWTHEAILRRMDDAILTMETNNHGKPLEPYILSRVLTALMNIPGDDVRSSYVLRFLYSSNFRREPSEAELPTLLAESAKVAWSTKYDLSEKGFPCPTALKDNKADDGVYVPQTTSHVGRPLVLARRRSASVEDENSKIDLLKAITYLFEAFASQNDQVKHQLIKALMVQKPKGQGMAALWAVFQAAYNFTPRADDVPWQNVLEERAKMLGTVLEVAGEVFKPQIEARQTQDWFPFLKHHEGMRHLPTFLTMVVQKSCELVSALADNKKKLELLKQVVGMSNWAGKLCRFRFDEALEMIRFQIDTIPKQIPGQQRLSEKFFAVHMA